MDDRGAPLNSDLPAIVHTCAAHNHTHTHTHTGEGRQVSDEYLTAEASAQTGQGRGGGQGPGSRPEPAQAGARPEPGAFSEPAQPHSLYSARFNVSARFLRLSRSAPPPASGQPLPSGPLSRWPHFSGPPPFSGQLPPLVGFTFPVSLPPRPASLTLVRPLCSTHTHTRWSLLDQ